MSIGDWPPAFPVYWTLPQTQPPAAIYAHNSKVAAVVTYSASLFFDHGGRYSRQAELPFIPVAGQYLEGFGVFAATDPNREAIHGVGQGIELALRVVRVAYHHHHSFAIHVVPEHAVAYITTTGDWHYEGA